MCLGKLPLGVGGLLNSGASPLKAAGLGLAGMLLSKKKKTGAPTATAQSGSFG